MKQDLHCDVAIVGAGSAGLSAYREVVKAGLKPLLIEAAEHGTMCARVGCMPSKLLIAAAQAALDAQRAADFGVHIGSIRVDGQAVMDRVRRERDRFVGFVVDDVQAMPAEHRLDARVSFEGPGLLCTDHGQRIHAQRIILATGTAPRLPDTFSVLGDLVDVNDDVFEWTDLPRRVLVVGAGVIGVELGLALAHLGVYVRTLTHSASFAHLQDPAVHEQAIQLMGGPLNLVQQARITQLRRENNRAVVSWSVSGGPEVTEEFDRVLMTAGRHSLLPTMHPERAGIHLDPKGFPKFDPRTLQVQNLPIFVAGDATGRSAIQHEASDDGRRAGRNASTWPELQAPRRRAPLSIVFSEPQIMQVGAGFQQLDRDAVAIGQVDYSRQGRSRVMLRNQGILRVYMRQSDQRLLGAEMVGPDAEHMAHLLAWALQMELTVPQVLALPFYHPTVEEGVRTALRDALSSGGNG